MNVSLLLLSSAWLAADTGPIVVNGAGCTNCGSAAAVASPSYSSPSFASASFGAAACGGSCGSARAGLFDRLRARFSRPASAGCGTADCGPPVAAAACGTPACGSPLRSSFVASHTATAAPACGPALRSSFVAVGSSGCCDASPCGSGSARVGLFSRLRARTNGSGACGGCGTPTATVVAAPACGGCTGGVGTVHSSPYYGGTVVGSSPVAPPVVMPAPIVTPGPVVMPPPPVDKPKDKEPKKEPVKDKTNLEPAPIVPLVPSDLPRIPTLNGTSGN